MVMLTGLCSTSIASTADAVQRQAPIYSASPVMHTLPYSIYILGFAFGSLFGLACHDIFSRRWALCSAILSFSLFQLGAGLSKVAVLLIIFRFFSGLAAGACSFLSFSVSLDMWKYTARTAPATILVLTLMIGQYFGFVSSTKSLFFEANQHIALSSALS